MSVWLLLRVAVYPAATVYQKKLLTRGVHAGWVALMSYGVIALAFFPAVIHGLSGVASGFWLDMAVCAVLDAVGNVLLLESLSRLELSVFGPINSFKPWIGVILAWVFVHEVPGLSAFFGMFLILSGSFVLSRGEADSEAGLRGRLKSFFGWALSAPFLMRIGGIVCSSFGAVFSKKALGAASPEVVFFFWGLMGLPVLLIYLGMKRIPVRENLGHIGEKPLWAVAAVFFYSLTQWLTLRAFTTSAVGPALAVFQLSTVIQVILGKRVFQERGFMSRMAASLVMAAGGGLILWAPF